MRLNEYIDYTLLASDATTKEIEKLCIDAENYKFASVCVNPYFVKFVKNTLKNNKVKICTVIGFPLGVNSTEIKVAETKKAISDGADEIDMVINISALKDGFYDYVLNEIKDIKAVCASKILKVIVETAVLTEKEKIDICNIISKTNADFIKTSTGFAKSGAKVKDIKLFKKHLKNTNIKIKASGKIKTKAQAIKLHKAGADRLGMSKATLLITKPLK